MKKIICTLVSLNGVLHLHIGYEPVILPKHAQLISTFNVSDVYLHFDSNHCLPSELL